MQRAINDFLRPCGARGGARAAHRAPRQWALPAPRALPTLSLSRLGTTAGADPSLWDCSRRRWRRPQSPGVVSGQGRRARASGAEQLRTNAGRRGLGSGWHQSWRVAVLRMSRAPPRACVSALSQAQLGRDVYMLTTRRPNATCKTSSHHTSAAGRLPLPPRMVCACPPPAPAEPAAATASAASACSSSMSGCDAAAAARRRMEGTSTPAPAAAPLRAATSRSSCLTRRACSARSFCGKV